MNIEQIKADWIKHCKEYGFKGLIVNSDTRDVFPYYFVIEGSGGYKNCIAIGTHLRDDAMICHNFKYYKCLATFYEKLLQASEDCDGLMKEMGDE